MFFHCDHHQNLEAFIHATSAAGDILPCKPTFAVFVASVLQLLLQPLVLVGRFNAEMHGPSHKLDCK